MWQRTMDTVLQGISGVKCIIDDMIITGSSEKEHLRNMEAVLTRLDEYNVRVNLNKCEFSLNAFRIVFMRSIVKAFTKV